MIEFVYVRVNSLSIPWMMRKQYCCDCQRRCNGTPMTANAQEQKAEGGHRFHLGVTNVFKDQSTLLINSIQYLACEKEGPRSSWYAMYGPPS
ncbi:hypothetical protein PAXRUDRAFT_440953 [Paxillus rubicundulus Ve08.2h10]|uniref:Uncharacterized protein n=1 Tax=Paxillus rubicundulus Ve08.2h10 TaxID=930991 RepID=A0A0D0DX25_9AGAM|nr:hypothetical protein PAXRUDRAFT_440953 [Paxillus rubicundulus Ve08.2h10]